MASDESRTRRRVDTDNVDFKNTEHSSAEISKTDYCDQTALDLSCSHRAVDMCTNRVKSYVFFDTESTGLKDAGHQPKMTELCMLAVQREELHPDGGQPRVTNKLTACLNPRQVITPSASMITGLFNDHLENQKPFTSEMAKMVTSFLERLPPPVCLIAHNGNNFDYPLLHSELKQVNESLPGSLLCADSLECFREMMSEQIAAEMVRESTSMKQNSEQTPPKRTSFCGDAPVGAKKPRKNPVMQDILYSNVNKEAATRRLDFDANDQTEVCSSIDGSFELNSTADSKHEQQLSKIAIRNKIDIKSDKSVVKKLTFTDDVMHFVEDTNLENQRTIAANKTTASSSVDSLQHLQSNDLTDSQYDRRFQLNMPTPESSPRLTRSADVETINLAGQSQNCENMTHRSSVCHTNTDIQEIYCVDKDSEKVMSSDSQDTSQTNLNSQTSLTDNELVLAVKNIETMSTNREHIPSTDEVQSTKHQESNSVNMTAEDNSEQKDIQSTSDVKHHEYSSGPQDVIQNHHRIALSRDPNRKCDPASSSLDSEMLSPDMSTIPLPVTKYSPFINISPTTSAQMRNENQQKSDEVAHVRLTSPTPVKMTASTTTTESSPVKTFPSRMSFKLEEIYRRCYGQLPPAAHNAEDDCTTLLKVVKKHSPQFLEWVDRHAVPFNTISPMY